MKSGKIRFSEAVESSSSLVSEVKGFFKTSFLWLFNTTEWQPSVNWDGDELILETKDGNVDVYFDDENAAVQPQSGFLQILSKIFKF